MKLPSKWISQLRFLGSSVLAFFAALIPVFRACPPCPTCMPIYAAILSVLGLELADYSAYVFPVMTLSIVFSMGSMWYQIQEKQLSYAPFILGCASYTALLLSKYVSESSFFFYPLLLAFVSSIIWHRYHYTKIAKCCDCGS